MAFNPIERLLVAYQIAVAEARVALAKTQQVNGIQHIRFPHSVQPRQTIETLREVEMLTLVIFEVGQFEPGEKQIRTDSRS